MPATPAIAPAKFPDDLAIVRALFREYADRLGVDLCFQGFEAELANLPGDYASPRGQLLLATDGGHALGCVALRPIDAATCEMKRLYVRPEARGLRLGRLLVERLIADARSAGYARICLDTLPAMTEAQALYHSLGFADIAPYVYNPIAGTRYMGLEIRA